MGEGEIIDLYSEKYIFICWNMDDYPIPDGIDDFGFIRINIEEALHRLGFHGYKEFNVHCKLISCEIQEELGKAGIIYSPSCTRTYMYSAAVNKVVTFDMTADMVHSAIVTGPDPMDIVVIAKPKVELDRVLKCLVSRGHNVLFIDPTGYSGSFFSVESLVGSALLFRPSGSIFVEDSEDFSQGQEDPSEGEEEVEEDPSECEEAAEDPSEDEEEAEEDTSDFEEEDEEDSSDFEEDPFKIVDFLEPMRPTKGARTAVFWDAEDCPFPLFSTPDEIYDKIESALLERGFSGKLSIWVYLDDDKKGSWRDVFLGDKKWASRIYFLPGGDKASRRIRMLNDITFWAKDPPDTLFQESLILVSDQFKDDAYYIELLQNLVCGRCDIVLVTPTQDINKPESPEWPRLLIDGGAYRVGDGTREISEETPDIKKPESRERPAELLIDVGFIIPEAEEETHRVMSAIDYSRLLESLNEWPAGLLSGGGAC